MGIEYIVYRGIYYAYFINLTSVRDYALYLC